MLNYPFLEGDSFVVYLHPGFGLKGHTYPANTAIPSLVAVASLSRICKWMQYN